MANWDCSKPKYGSLKADREVSTLPKTLIFCALLLFHLQNRPFIKKITTATTPFFVIKEINIKAIRPQIVL